MVRLICITLCVVVVLLVIQDMIPPVTLIGLTVVPGDPGRAIKPSLKPRS